MATMPGWPRPAAALASRRNRATRASSSAAPGRRTFTATSRPRTSSVARYTVAIPPEPRVSWTAYRPAMVVCSSCTGPVLPGRRRLAGHGGRHRLGLGSQVKRVNEERFGVPFEHPAPKMGEYVEAVREVLGSFEGSAPRHEGRFYRITMAPFPGASGVGDVPIYLAAVNERMAEQAGRVADGISGHPMNSPAY